MRAALAGLAALAAAAVLTATAPRIHAQPAPRAMAAAGIEERLGAQVPLDAPFTAAGRGPVTLRDLLDGRRPALLVIAYARCTMLCSLVLRGAMEAARRMPLAPGRDYHLVLVGLDTRETEDEARRKQAALLADLGRGGDPAAWPYLRGSRSSIDAVAAALGFRYAWDARTEQYAHPAVLFALTPDGRAARYLHGVQHDPAEVAAALEDAAAGRLLSTASADVLRCFRFDPAARRAGARAQLFLQAGAACVLAALATLIALLVRCQRRRSVP